MVTDVEKCWFDSGKRFRVSGEELKEARAREKQDILGFFAFPVLFFAVFSFESIIRMRVNLLFDDVLAEC